MVISLGSSHMSSLRPENNLPTPDRIDVHFLAAPINPAQDVWSLKASGPLATTYSALSR